MLQTRSCDGRSEVYADLQCCKTSLCLEAAADWEQRLRAALTAFD